MSSYRTFLPGQTLADDEIQDLGLRGTYTPVLQGSSSNPTLGTGSTATGDWHLNNGMVTVGFTIQFGTSGTAAGSGTYRVTLPSGMGIDADWQDNRATGQAFANDASGSLFYFFLVRASGSNPDTMVFGTTGTTTAASGSVTEASPIPWAANDYIRGSFTYKTDFT